MRLCPCAVRGLAEEQPAFRGRPKRSTFPLASIPLPIFIRRCLLPLFVPTQLGVLFVKVKLVNDIAAWEGLEIEHHWPNPRIRSVPFYHIFF